MTKYVLVHNHDDYLGLSVIGVYDLLSNAQARMWDAMVDAYGKGDNMPSREEVINGEIDDVYFGDEAAWISWADYMEEWNILTIDTERSDDEA